MKSNSTIEDIMSGGPVSRRSLFQAAGIGAAAIAATLPAVAAGGKVVAAMKGGATITDEDILNFALNLEYLEAEFYSYGVTGHGIPAEDMAGVGNTGPTTGGSQIVWDSTEQRHIATEIMQDELKHVVFLRTALGSAAVAKPEINLNALGTGFQGPRHFFVLARAFEDVGVSAYGGAANMISNKDYLQAAARILATEAYHAGNVREMVADSNINFAVDSQDQIPTINDFFPTNSQGLAIIRTVGEVAAIVRGPNASGGAFFPMGLNGTIK